MTLETRVIGLAGLTGTGKSTAICILERLTRARRIYLGEVVLSRVREMGLPLGANSEKKVRAELEAEHGPLFALKLRAAEIRQTMSTGTSVLVDAVLRPQERDELRRIAGSSPCYVIAMRSTFENRRVRLSLRKDRPFNEAAILTRDAYEMEALALGHVLENAEITIDNDGTVDELEQALAAFLASSQA